MIEDTGSTYTPFNSALETGVRSLIVLTEAYPAAFDVQRLVYFDYLVVHSADAGGPASLHPNTPLRNGELLVRRGMIERGILLMVSRNLAERHFDKKGISYSASDEASPFLDCLTTDYNVYLRKCAQWAVREFGELNERDLKAYFDGNFERWTREFQSTSPASEGLL